VRVRVREPGEDGVVVTAALTSSGTRCAGWERTSADGRYRYLLGRRWASGPLVLWVLANPSTADAFADDPTLRRCIGFSAAHGYAGLVVVNLWAWRATHPRELRHVADPDGPENDARVAEAVAASAGPVVLGWGRQGEHSRTRTVLGLLVGRPLRCLGVTSAGQPRHPLYVPSATLLRPWADPRC
jgi:hypothetical protein